MITCKDSVRVSVLRLPIVSILEKIFAVFKRFGYPCIITCWTDSHPPDDVHTAGFALDLRTKHIETMLGKEEIAAELRRVLGPIYTVLFESVGGDNEHIHCQLRKDIWRSMV